LLQVSVLADALIASCLVDQDDDINSGETSDQGFCLLRDMRLRWQRLPFSQ